MSFQTAGTDPVLRNTEQARKWVVISALVVAGVWAYRRWREGPQPVMQFSEFVTAWAAVYFVLALTAEAAPRFAGSFAILIGTADILTQGKQLIADVDAQRTGSTQPSGVGGGFSQLSPTFPGSAPHPGKITITPIRRPH